VYVEFCRTSFLVGGFLKSRRNGVYHQDRSQGDNYEVWKYVKLVQDRPQGRALVLSEVELRAQLSWICLLLEM
jgi:hypothetical protein